MQLSRLIENLTDAEHGGLPEMDISALTADSRQVIPDALFIAMRGENYDGHDYIADAVKQGAGAVVGEIDPEEIDIVFIRVADPRLALAELAAAWNGFPSHSLTLIGVTGTDGKSTTCNLLFEILCEAGIKTGMITTVNAVIGDRVLDTGLHVTTPDALEVQGYLREMVGSGLTHCILEATSHGLAQHRLSACEFDVAVVTNITHEHLDYHGSYEAYVDTKAGLFRNLDREEDKTGGPAKTAVLNMDDRSYDLIQREVRARQVTYGHNTGADVVAHEISSSREGLTFKISSARGEVSVHSPLIGEYNVMNCLAAFTAAVEGLGVEPQIAADGLAQLRAIPGRMEVIDLGQPFTAIVDFAHTPNALQRALESARCLTAGDVIAVFGSAGLRDREKRRMMAQVSARQADKTILTAEDPRTESLAVILDEMAQGALSERGIERETFWRVPDRGEALRFAVRMAKPGDLVISCGKGHEQSMCFGEIEYPWDDRVAMRAALSELLGVDGPQMPTLPTSPPENYP
ncbi:MAG: UDP-N-acetylmuramoyl-L-alanyl-D-glutamate--2,6-diaminopimelate ligase [Anaerolineales bacterium]|nr:UDP-N-acetylmuramoyl-L-alanyl-D-glutamate--2,6-diaminopimelate ligase [Anaerolineales bacterium]